MSHHSLRLTPPKWEYLLEVMVLLLRQCDLLDLPPSQVDYSPLSFEPHDQLTKIDPNLRIETQLKKVYRRVVENGFDNNQMSNVLELVQLVAWENQPFSNDVIMFVTKGVEAVGPDQVGSYMRLMYALVSLDDTLYPDRIAKLHMQQSGVLFHIKFFRKAHAPFSFVCISHLVEMMRDIPQYKESMKKCREQWEWMDEWLKRHSRAHDAGNRYYQYNQRSNKQAADQAVWEKYQALVKEMGFTMEDSEDDNDNFVVSHAAEAHAAQGMSDEDDDDIYASAESPMST